MTSGTRRRRLALPVVLGAAAVLRVAWVVYGARRPEGLRDPNVYLFFAARIAAGEGYSFADGAPTAYYPPGFPIFLGGVVWLLENTPLPDDAANAVGTINVVLGVASVWFVWVIGREVGGARVGLAAAALVALWPNLIFHTGVLLTETLFLFLFLGAVALVLRLPAGRRWLVAAGLLFGLAALVRPVGLLALPMLGLSRVTSWRKLGVVSLVTLAVMLSWTVRNTIRMGEVVPIATNTGDDLCIGNTEGATGGFVVTPVCFGHTDLPNPEGELRRDEENTRRAIEYVTDNPGEVPRLVWQKAVELVRQDHDGLAAAESYGVAPFMADGLRRALSGVADWYFWVVLVVGAVSLPLAWRAGPAGRFVVLTFLALALLPLVFFGDARFHVPAVPLLAVSAVSGLRRR